MSGSQGPQSCCVDYLDFSDLDALCAVMPRPLVVTGILRKWMIKHFTTTASIESPFMQQYLWTDDITTTGIVIDSVYRWLPALTEKRPGIFIKRGPWQVVRRGIDDRRMPNINQPQCTTVYNNFYQGSHTLFCIAGESAETEILAAEVYREFVQRGPEVRKEFNFLRFVVSEIGELSILEEATENFVVPVVVSYVAQDVWTICPSDV